MGSGGGRYAGPGCRVLVAASSQMLGYSTAEAAIPPLTRLDNLPRMCDPAGMSTTPANTGPFRYCGRVFSEAEIEVIRGITEDPWHTTRKDIARAVCAALNWVQPDGAPKVVSCHVALQRMEAHGVIWLPLPTREATHRRRPTWTAASAPQPPITGTRADLAALRLDLVGERDQARLWNELVERHHYLGATPMAGAQCRYLAYDGARLLGALGFGAAAWRLAGV